MTTLIYYICARRRSVLYICESTSFNNVLCWPRIFVLYIASLQLFKKFAQPTIFLITCNDRPHSKLMFGIDHMAILAHKSHALIGVTSRGGYMPYSRTGLCY